MSSSEPSKGPASDDNDVAAQLAKMQKLIQEQAEQMRAQQEALERERQERNRREEELKSYSNGKPHQVESGLGSGMTSVLSSISGDAEALTELEQLRRQLNERERELRAKEDQIKERDERLSLLTQRSDTTNSLASEDQFGARVNVKLKNGELPVLNSSVCSCTLRGFEHCIVYKKDICKCSFSCSFVQEYFKPPKECSVFLA